MRLRSLPSFAPNAVFAALCLLAAPSQAALLISQVYGGGGNSNATLSHDYVELRNTGSSPVSLSGLSLQYAASTGSNWSKLDLVGTVPANGYFLVRLATNNAAVGAPLTSFDQASTSIHFGATRTPILRRSPVNITSGNTANGSWRLSTTWLRISSCPVPRSP